LVAFSKTWQPDAASGIDTWLAQPYDTNNYGTTGEMQVGGSGADAPRRGLILPWYDTSSLPVTTVISTAVLSLYCDSEGDTNDYAIGAHRALTQWHEGAQDGNTPAGGENASVYAYRNYNGSVAWGAAGGLAGTDYVATPEASTTITGTGVYFDWDIKSLMQQWVSTTVANYGLWLINTSENTASSRKYFMPSDAIEAKRPKLVVTGLTLPEYVTLTGIYVATDGNDSTGDGSITTPYLTISKAASVVAAGQTIFVRSGTYTEAVTIDADGTAEAPITLRNYPGETVVIDGGGTLPESYTGLITVNGDYVTVRGLQITNSAFWATGVYGQHCTLSYLTAYSNTHAGLLAFGDYSTIEYSTAYRNSMDNYQGALANEGGWGTGITLCRVSHGTPVNHGTIRHCTAYENWGEGISTFESNYTTIEDNVSYDNYSTNYYLSDSVDAVLQRNLAYNTPGGYMHGDEPDEWNYHYGAGGSNVGILVGNEGYTPALARLQILNNIVYGCNRNIYVGSNVIDTLIAYNTVVSSTYLAEMVFNSNLQAITVTNNIAMATDDIAMVSAGDQTHVTYSYNNWSKSAPAYASGTGDVVGDPFFSAAGSVYTAPYYHLTASSPGISHAIAISQTTEDYFQVARDANPDIGASEWVP
jgi:hypothetical protein